MAEDDRTQLPKASPQSPVAANPAPANDAHPPAVSPEATAVPAAERTVVATAPEEPARVEETALATPADAVSEPAAAVAEPAAAEPAAAVSEASEPAVPSETVAPAPRPRSFISRLVPKSPTAAIQPVLAPPPAPAVSGRPERPVVNFLSGMFSFLLVLGLGAAAVVYFTDKEIRAPGPLANDKVVVVKGGAGDVTEQLQREGVIDKPMLFLFGLYTTGASSQMKAGEYLFRREASLAEIMETLVEGKSVLHSFAVPEGLTTEQIVERLRENDILSGEIRETPREGTLLPETYKFSRGMSRSQVLDRMAQDHARVVREVWARRSPELPLKSPQELVILASIVEKETGRADERTRVAGVFVNRLNRNMRLQSDPTIIYGLVGGKGSLGRSITRADIESQTAYNTYVIPGLPPGPIGNPGRAALEAVANPSRTKDLYFVADGTGGHVFAETLDQHNRNVQRWRQIEGERREASAAAPAPAAAPVAPAPVAEAARTEPVADAVPNPDLPKVPPLPPEPPADLRRPAAAAAATQTSREPGSAPAGFDLNSPKTVPKLD